MHNNGSMVEHPAQDEACPQHNSGAVEKGDYTIVSFSSDDIPAQERLSRWNGYRDYMALTVEIEPAEGHLFTSHFTSCIVPQLRLLAGFVSRS
jgi:hypothetical protein